MRYLYFILILLRLKFIKTFPSEHKIENNYAKGKMESLNRLQKGIGQREINFLTKRMLYATN